MGVRAEASPKSMTQVLDLVLTAGDYDGSLVGHWKVVKAAKSYEIQLSADPVTATSWTYKMTATRRSAVLKELSNGAKLWARVRALGADNAPGPWSDPAVKTVP